MNRRRSGIVTAPMHAALKWTFSVVVVAPVLAWADAPRDLDDFDSAVQDFCAERDALTKQAVAASKTDQRFQLASAIEEHRRQQRNLDERAGELRASANGVVARTIVKLEALGHDASAERARLARLGAQLEGCASVDDGFIAWATQRTQTLAEEDRQTASLDAYERHIARGAPDLSLEERVVHITPPSIEQTIALYTEVNPERFVFAARPLAELGAPGRSARHRTLMAGEAFLITSTPVNGRVRALTVEGLQFEVDVSGLSLTPLKGKKAAPIEPSWLRVADPEAAYMPLIPAIARVTGLFPQKR